MNQKQKEKEEAIARLREWIKPGDTVYTVLRHVSSSGMSRVISVVLIKPGKSGEEPVMLHPNHAVAAALGLTLVTKGGSNGVKMGGCGMDMGFALVYELGAVLFPGGDGKYTRGRNGMTGPETNGGYLLNQRWL